MVKIKKSGIVIIALFFLGSIMMGSFLGWSVSETRNIINSEYISDFDTALPTKLLDINGEVITEFASDEKREIIAYNNLPVRQDTITVYPRPSGSPAASRTISSQYIRYSICPTLSINSTELRTIRRPRVCQMTRCIFRISPYQGNIISSR